MRCDVGVGVRVSTIRVAEIRCRDGVGGGVMVPLTVSVEDDVEEAPTAETVTVRENWSEPVNCVKSDAVLSSNVFVSVELMVRVS